MCIFRDGGFWKMDQKCIFLIQYGFVTGIRGQFKPKQQNNVFEKVADPFFNDGYGIACRCTLATVWQ